MKIGVDGVGVDTGESGLPGAGCAPKCEREDVPLLDREAQRLAGTDEVLLPDELLKIPRPYPVGEGFHY
jgi:hypothetical protein